MCMQQSWTWCLLQVMAILGVSFSIWWFMLASESAKATLEEFAAPVLGALASAYGWLLDSALALKDRIQGASDENSVAVVQHEPACKSSAGPRVIMHAWFSPDMLHVQTARALMLLHLLLLPGGPRRELDHEADQYFQPLASGDDFGLDEEEAHSPVNLNGHA